MRKVSKHQKFHSNKKLYPILQGEDAVPETVHHCFIRINPTNHQDLSPGSQMARQIRTDGVHKKDQIDMSNRDLYNSEGNRVILF